MRSARRSIFAAFCARTPAISASIPRRPSPNSTRTQPRTAASPEIGEPANPQPAHRGSRGLRADLDRRRRGRAPGRLRRLQRADAAKRAERRCDHDRDAPARPRRRRRRRPPARPVAHPRAGGPHRWPWSFSAPSWLRVTVDGNVSMEGTFPAGTFKTFHGKNALGAHR